MLIELKYEFLILILLVVLLSAAPTGAAGVVPTTPTTAGATPPEEPKWKKYLKYLGLLLVGTLLGLTFFYLVGQSTGGDDPPGSSPDPWTPAGLPTELFDRRAGWGAAEWSNHLVWASDQEVYDAIGRFVELKSNRVLKPEVVQRLGDLLHIPHADRQDLPWYIRQRMVETAPAETARAIEVARQSLEGPHGYRECCRRGMVAVEQRHGTRLYEFALEYKQKR